MTIDKAKLKALAQAVADLEDIPEREEEHAEAKDALWLHMHCHTILALLTEIERLKADNRSLRGSCAKTGSENAGLSRQLKKATRQSADARAELAGLRTGYDAQNEVIAGLRAENEALRKDAERYRWLRRGENYAHQYLVDLGMENLDGFDRSIDAAMAKEAIHDR